MEDINTKRIMSIFLFYSLIILISQTIFYNMIKENGIKVTHTIRHENVTVVKNESIEEESLYDYIIVAKYKDSDGIHHFIVFRDIDLKNQSIYDFKIYGFPLPPFYDLFEIGNHVVIKYNTKDMSIIKVRPN